MISMTASPFHQKMTESFIKISGYDFRSISDISSYETFSAFIKVLTLKRLHFLPALIRPLGLYTQALKLVFPFKK
jgi:hypothetical protein